MKPLPSLTVIAFAVLIFSSCKNNGKSNVAVPKDAAIVFHINSSSLSSKLSWQEIRQTNWFKQMYSESHDTLAQKIMNDPESSGIDSKSDITFFIKKQGNGGFGVLEGTVKDAAAFETFSKGTKNKQTQKEGDWFFIKNDNESLVMWNKSKFAFIIDMPQIGRINSLSSMGNMGNTEIAKFSTDSLKKFVTAILTMDKNNSLGEDERFANLLKQNGDVHVWMNTGQLYSGMGGGMMSMMKINTLFEGSISAATLSFDEGKISMKTKQYYGKEMNDLIKKYEPKPVSADVINRIPSQNIIGAFVMNYPPEGIKAFLQATGFDGLANGFLGKYNYSLDEFITAYKGQLVFAATDLEVKQVKQPFEGMNQPYISARPDIKILFALSVNNKAAFEKLIGIATSQEGAKQSLSKVFYKVNTDWFAVSNSSETVDKFLAGGNNKLPFADKISGHPFGMYIDIQKIMKASGSFIKDSSGVTALNASIKLWQDVVATGGEYKNGGMTGEVVVNLVDKKTNSLKQLNQYFEQLAALKKSKNQQNYQSDSTSVYTPPMADNTALH